MGKLAWLSQNMKLLHMSLLLREEGETDYPFTKCPFEGENVPKERK